MGTVEVESRLTESVLPRACFFLLFVFVFVFVLLLVNGSGVKFGWAVSELVWETHAADACCECAFGPHMIFPHVRKQTRRCYPHVSLRMSNIWNIWNLLLKLTFLVKSILSCLFSQTSTTISENIGIKYLYQPESFIQQEFVSLPVLDKRRLWSNMVWEKFSNDFTILGPMPPSSRRT